MTEVARTQSASGAVRSECPAAYPRCAESVALSERDDRTVRRYAWALVGQAGITRSDVEDIEQELRFELLTYLHRFDGSRGRWRTFINCLLERKCVDILRHRFAEMRAFNGSMRSLEDEIETDGEPALLLDTVTRVDQDRRLIASPRPILLDLGLEIDLREAAARLPPKLRPIYEDLRTKSICQIAAERGLHRRTVERRAARLRRWMETWAIRNSLKISAAFQTSQTKERNRAL